MYICSKLQMRLKMKHTSYRFGKRMLVGALGDMAKSSERQVRDWTRTARMHDTLLVEILRCENFPDPPSRLSPPASKPLKMVKQMTMNLGDKYIVNSRVMKHPTKYSHPRAFVDAVKNNSFMFKNILKGLEGL
jgi:hypothetical protein